MPKQHSDIKPRMTLHVDGVDEQQLSLFEGADFLEVDDEIAPAGVGTLTQIKKIPGSDSGRNEEKRRFDSRPPAIGRD